MSSAVVSATRHAALSFSRHLATLPHAETVLASEARAAAAALAPLARLSTALAAVATTFTPSVDEAPPERALGGWVLYTRCERGGSPLLLRRPAAGGAESVLLDCGAVADTLRAESLSCVRPSPCGSTVAVVADTGGDAHVAAIVRVEDQKIVAKLPGVASVDWWRRPGSAADLVFVSCDPHGRPAAAHVADEIGDNAALLYEEPEQGLTLVAAATKDGAAIALTSAAPAAAAVRAVTRHTPTPTLISPASPGLETFMEHWAPAGGLIALTNAAVGGEPDSDGGPGREYTLASLGTATSARLWRPLLPRHRPSVAITDVDVFDSGVLAYERDTGTGGPRATLVAPALHGTSTTHTVHLPPWATVLRGGANADPASPTARVVLASPLHPDTSADVCVATGRLTLVPRPPAAQRAADAVTAAVSTAGLAVSTVTVGDGVTVSVVKGGGVQSQPAPMLLTLYGAYGAPFVDPDFHATHLALATRHGWYLAYASVRGGGERGRAWHAAGRGARRGAALKDAHSVLDFAVATSRGRVALTTESAGALLVGALIAHRPADIAAAVLRAPCIDLTEADSFTAGEDGEFAPPGAPPSSLAAISPLHMLAQPAVQSAAAACRGPPVLIQVARHDARAPAAAAARWSAALRSARGPGGAPVVCHVCPGGWHATPGGEAGRDLDAQAAAWCVAAVEGRL